MVCECGNIFDVNRVPESGMGYVKCPKCGKVYSSQGKMKNEILFKNFSGSIKDVDVKNGIVTGYFAAFDNLDFDNQMFIRGAFKKTIKENGPEGKNKIMHLLHHDIWRPLSKPTVLKEDNTGLYFESPISHTTYGKDTILLYADGVYNEHSVGFIIMKDGHDTEGKNSYQTLLEVKLFEGSTVTWGANDQTPFVGFKNKEYLCQRIDLLTKSLHKGNYTDETFRNLEIELLNLKSLLTQTEPPPGTPQESEPTTEGIFLSFKKQLGIS